MSENNKKRRSANFTPNETVLLMSLIVDFKHIIENKKTDSICIQEKNRAWRKITVAFNSACPESRHRTMESLKKLYDNKKRETRKQKAEEKKDILLTGGGTPQVKVKDPAQDLILSIVDPLTVVGGKSCYGSDSLQLRPLASPSTSKNDYFTFELEDQDENIIIINQV